MKEVAEIEDSIEIKKENVTAALELCDEKTEGILRKLFGFENKTKDGRPATERVTRWDDVLRELGENHPYVKELQELEQHALKEDEFLINAHKLRMVCEVLNEGWRPDFHNREYRYYPCFYFYTTKEDAEKYARDDEYVFEIPEPLRACLWDGDASNGSPAGLGYARTSTAPSPTNAALGSRLCLKTRELALHTGKYFNELWLKYLFL